MRCPSRVVRYCTSDKSPLLVNANGSSSWIHPECAEELYILLDWISSPPDVSRGGMSQILTRARHLGGEWSFCFSMFVSFRRKRGRVESSNVTNYNNARVHLVGPFLTSKADLQCPLPTA